MFNRSFSKPKKKNKLQDYSNLKYVCLNVHLKMSRIPDFDSHSSALLALFISSDTSICSVMAFSLWGNSYHIIVSVSIDWLSVKLKTGCPVLSHHSLLLFSCWLRRSSWEMFHGRISLNQGLIEAKTDNGIPCLGASNLGAQGVKNVKNILISKI